MTTIQEQIALLQAIADDRTLQFASKHAPTSWKDANPDWHDGVKQGFQSIDVVSYNWRIKPEPRVIWVNEYSNSYLVSHKTEKAAKESAGSRPVSIAVKYQEVL